MVKLLALQRATPSKSERRIHWPCVYSSSSKQPAKSDRDASIIPITVFFIFIVLFLSIKKSCCESMPPLAALQKKPMNGLEKPPNAFNGKTGQMVYFGRI